VFRFADTTRQEEWAAERPIVQAQDTVSIRKPTNSGVTQGTAARRKAVGERRWHAREDSCGRRSNAFLAADSGRREKRGAARPKSHAQDASQQRETVKGPT
jgi:hypothetical protein